MISTPGAAPSRRRQGGRTRPGYDDPPPRRKRSVVGGVVDGKDTDPDQDGVEVLDRGGQQSDAGLDESVGVDVAQDIGHEREGKQRIGRSRVARVNGERNVGFSS